MQLKPAIIIPKETSVPEMQRNNSDSFTKPVRITKITYVPKGQTNTQDIRSNHLWERKGRAAEASHCESNDLMRPCEIYHSSNEELSKGQTGCLHVHATSPQQHFQSRCSAFPQTLAFFQEAKWHQTFPQKRHILGDTHFPELKTHWQSNGDPVPGVTSHPPSGGQVQPSYPPRKNQQHLFLTKRSAIHCAN